MNICLITANYPPMPWPCGLADFTERLATNLRKAGIEVAVLTSNSKAETESPFPVHVLPGNWGYKHRRRIVSIIRKERFDVFDLQYESFAFGQTFRPLWLPFHFSSPTPIRTLTLHSQVLPKLGGRYWRPLQIRPWDKVVFYSEPFMKRMISHFPSRSHRFHLQGFPSNIAEATAPHLRQLVSRLKSEWHDPRQLLVYFGHITPNRGIEEILSAMTTLRLRGLRPQLAILSQFNPQENEYHRKLLMDISDLQLTEQVAFTGQLPADQVSHFFQAADVVVLPFPEGASFKNGTLSAALTHGAAIVTTLTDLSESALRNGAVAGYSPGDSVGLADQLTSLLTSCAKKHSLMQSSKQLGETLTWDTYITNRITMYDVALQTTPIPR